jgi:predicted RNA binding protein YcfA (HicA-like mRNA interferase family)
MPQLPAITARTMIRFLISSGFELKRQKGSHKFFAHPDGRTATVPDHPGEDLGPGLLRKILNDIEVTREDFLQWLAK